MAGCLAVKSQSYCAGFCWLIVRHVVRDSVWVNEIIYMIFIYMLLLRLESTALGCAPSQMVSPSYPNVYIYICIHCLWSFAVRKHAKVMKKTWTTKDNQTFFGRLPWLKGNNKNVSILTFYMVSCANTIFRWNCFQGIIALQCAYEGNYRLRRLVKQLVTPKRSCKQMGAPGSECC